MRPDFAAIWEGRTAMADLAATVDRARLRALTDDYYDEVAAEIADATDAHVVAVPLDPALEDQTAGEGAWTLAHVIAHLTASQEEGAARSSVLARGVELPDGTRLRAEAPWQSLATVEQVRGRLDESRRMCLAFLDTWPDTPDLELTTTLIPRLGPLNAVASYLLGLAHTDGHLAQVREIMRQMREGAGQASAG